MILRQLTAPEEMIKKIEDLILKIYEFSRSYPDSEEWLDSCVKVYGIPDVKTLEESSFMKKVMTDIRKNLDDARELLLMRRRSH